MPTIERQRQENHGIANGNRRLLVRHALAAGVFFFPLWLLALDRGDLLFYAAFDGSLKADYAQGNAEPKTQPECRFEKGVKGQAAVALQGITWDGKSNVRGDEGTFSFWFSPVDWASGDGKSHNFAFLDTANGLVRIYKYYPGNLGMLMQSDKGTRTCWTTRATLKKGVFRQVTFTWRPGEWTLFLDGLRMQKETDTVAPFGAISSFRLGDGNTVFDELLILRRAITEEEARILYFRVAQNR